jgi:omega-3 fatty acid desaturase (delta-15 desaturase)
MKCISFTVVVLFICNSSNSAFSFSAHYSAHHVKKTGISNVALNNAMILKSSALPIPSAKEETSSLIDTDEIELSLSNINQKAVPKAGEIMKFLPRDTFQIDTATGLGYFAIDFFAVALTMGLLDVVVTSDVYTSFPMWKQALTVAPLQVLTGFAMWCMWCIGHDAGHSTISKNRAINRIVGEISHSVMCLTPFVPWAKSHKKHHLNHNHLTMDYSHQWYIREEQDSLHPLIKGAMKTRILQLPILYFVYLFLGIPDGGHVIFYGRMWENESLREKLNAALSVAVSCTAAGSFWYNMGTADFTVVCMVPWMVMSFWLFMVTYLQHHSEDGKLYTDDTYSFERGAFETVDRNYGKYINRMSHHMMDGHVVHHLFFERVPHYKLEKATEALVESLEERGQADLYKFINTPDFTQEIVKQFYQNWFFINESQVVRK